MGYIDRMQPAPPTAFSPKLAILYDENEYHTRGFQAHHSSRQDSIPVLQHPSNGFITNGSAAAPHRTSVQRAMPSGRRFVAGEDFFNYDSFGSLRPDFAPIRLFSSAFLGLAVNALCAGFVITMTKYGYRQLLGEYLRVKDDSYSTSISFLLEWPGSFSVFIGFLSDCRPIGGRRRKPYMILGWAIAFLFFVLIVIVDAAGAKTWSVLDWQQTLDDKIDATVKHRVATYGGVLIALSLLARLAIQLMYIASLSMTVEFAQRETLRERGKLQAMYFVLFYVTAAIAQAAATLFVFADEDGHVRSKISLGTVAAVLAAVCLVPLPFLVLYLDEPSITGTTVHFSVRRRIHELWRFCHQNVVNRILAVLVLHFFLIGLYDKNARKAVSTWCNITEAKWPTINSMSTSGYCLALIFWMLYMVNWSWRKIAGIGTIVFVTGYITFTALVVFNVVRGDWFYTLLVSGLDMPTAWIRLYAVVLSTEIADNGREGVTMGLVYACQLMVGVSAHMLSAGIGDWLPFKVSAADIAADSTHTRISVFVGSMVVFCINLLSLLVLLVLPHQKLDAQQLRAFGGYNRYASYGIAAAFALLFSGNFAMNSIALSK